MTSRKILQRAVLAGLLLSSTTALADGDLVLTTSFVTDGIIKPAGIKQVKAHLSIAANQSATGITLDANALPPGPDHYEVSAVSNCTATGATPLPCTVADLVGTATAAASVDVIVTLKQPLPATCTATPPAYTALTLTATTTSVDPDTTNNSGTVTPTAASWIVADLGIDFAGPDQGTQNANTSYHVTVTNNGPCDVADANVSTDAAPGPVFASATWTCTNVPSPLPDPIGDYYEVNGCDLGAMVKGDVIQFDKVYFIPAMSHDAVQFYLFNGASVAGGTADPADPVASNDSSDLTITMKQSGSGCSTSGAGGPTGLLALGAVLALAFRRRRVA